MNYLILGANAAGLSAAVRILKCDKNAKITVLEKSEVVSFGSCGIPYYVAGEFTDIEQMTARPYQDFIKLGIDIKLQHEAIEIDIKHKTVISHHLSDKKQVEFVYDKLLIAVGASPSRPPVNGLDVQNVMTMHSRDDAKRIVNALDHTENVVIIGGGFIGLEAAEALRHQGKNVTLVEFAPRILNKAFDEQITTLLQQELVKNGVNLRTEEAVNSILSDNGKVTAVVTNKNSYLADLVIVATGFKPNTAFLKQSGIELTPQGAIIIDNACRTNIVDVYAAGDCATVVHCILGNTFIPLATTANKLGRLVGDVMAGHNSQFIGTLGSSGIRIFDFEAGRTGITEEEAKHNNIDYGVVFVKDKNHTDYVQPQTDIWVKLIYDKVSRVLLGGQICGAYLGGSVHRVDALAVAIYAKLTVEQLGFMDFIYAPPFARTWDVLNIAGNVAK
ncbi:NADPH-dependent 2,4-dienoyl-CoA reductase/sulfur reductase-like enzyme [Orbus hercynius]|uniref:NADPH-dependent 2,4-dienoyl-CoA reductase/sulfur reductase-like enzyme n=1 Tax=Orbus hercynius TaxID=593135 RepID=A0A495REJ3_9GAMM|nr:CoA-disulfide reductase [Orbus hercynius]RKS85902.1 NADPH-dependent 2,4-dienoyl-CoA reductase/sulfur reductase-like enzyme [Orbus hercynius]